MEAVAANPFFAAMVNEGVRFFDEHAYNRPLRLPGIESLLTNALGNRTRALLPGSIMAVSQSSSTEDDYETLGGDYDDEDDVADFVSWSGDDSDEVPV